MKNNNKTTLIKENDIFKIKLVNTRMDDKCEQCENKETPVYWIKGTNSNIDSMLCKKCLEKLREVLNFE